MTLPTPNKMVWRVTNQEDKHEQMTTELSITHSLTCNDRDAVSLHGVNKKTARKVKTCHQSTTSVQEHSSLCWNWTQDLHN